MALMMKLTLDSNNVLGYMHISIHEVSYEMLKLSKDGLNHFLLVVMPRISP